MSIQKKQPTIGPARPVVAAIPQAVKTQVKQQQQVLMQPKVPIQQKAPVAQPKYAITQKFGVKNPAIEVFSKGGINTGTDIGTPVGTPISTPAGKWQIVESYEGAKGKGYIGNKENKGYGNSVLVKNAQTNEMLRFSHLQQPQVKQGQTIEGGTIGLTGATGNVTGPHLDLEYYKDGKLTDIDNSPYLSQLFAGGVAQAREAMKSVGQVIQQGSQVVAQGVQQGVQGIERRSTDIKNRFTFDPKTGRVFPVMIGSLGALGSALPGAVSNFDNNPGMLMERAIASGDLKKIEELYKQVAPSRPLEVIKIDALFHSGKFAEAKKMAESLTDPAYRKTYLEIANRYAGALSQPVAAAAHSLSLGALSGGLMIPQSALDALSFSKSGQQQRL